MSASEAKLRYLSAWFHNQMKRKCDTLRKSSATIECTPK